jgi:hypothetical protein
MSKYFTSFYNSIRIIYANDQYVFDITGKHYTEKDWQGLSLDLLKRIGEPLVRSIGNNILDFNYTSFDISKVYDDTGNSISSFKYIYTGHKIEYNNQNLHAYYKYTFKKEGRSYVLFSIEAMPGDPKNEGTTHGNEKVEFLQNTNLK